jgi:hypothetical protein
VAPRHPFLAPIGSLTFNPRSSLVLLWLCPSHHGVLLYVDLKGNARVLWQYKGDEWGYGLPSPDGRYLAIQGRETNSNVWMLEGF